MLGQGILSLNPRLARDAWSMVIRLRQATIEYSPPLEVVSRKGRVANVHTTTANSK